MLITLIYLLVLPENEAHLDLEFAAGAHDNHIRLNDCTDCALMSGRQPVIICGLHLLTSVIEARHVFGR